MKHIVVALRALLKEPWLLKPFHYVCLCVSQPGLGTECCVCRSWASTIWRSCQLTCLMTPCMSAKHLMRPWGPGGPNSPSSVCLCTKAYVICKLCDMLCVSHIHLSFSSPPRWPSDRRGSGGAAQRGGVLQPELCVSRGQTTVHDRVA